MVRNGPRAAHTPPTQVRAPVTVVTHTGSGGHRDRVETARLCTTHVVLRLLGTQTHEGEKKLSTSHERHWLGVRMTERQ